MSFVLAETISGAIAADRGIECGVDIESTDKASDPVVTVAYGNVLIATALYSSLHSPSDILNCLPERFSSACTTIQSRIEFIRAIMSKSEYDLYTGAQALGIDTSTYLNEDEPIEYRLKEIILKVSDAVFALDDLSFERKRLAISMAA